MEKTENTNKTTIEAGNEFLNNYDKTAAELLNNWLNLVGKPLAGEYASYQEENGKAMSAQARGRLRDKLYPILGAVKEVDGKSVRKHATMVQQTSKAVQIVSDPELFQWVRKNAEGIATPSGAVNAYHKAKKAIEKAKAEKADSASDSGAGGNTATTPDEKREAADKLYTMIQPRLQEYGKLCLDPAVSDGPRFAELVGLAGALLDTASKMVEAEPTVGAGVQRTVAAQHIKWAETVRNATPAPRKKKAAKKTPAKGMGKAVAKAIAIEKKKAGKKAA